MPDSTLDYYNQNASVFSSSTVSVDFSSTQKRFTSYLKPGDVILDLGCGAGRDTKAFLDQGYRVEAADGSRELCRLASEFTGIRVKQMLFSELSDIERYDGIWACASILHLPKDELKDVMHKIARALVPAGTFYTSFKYGTFEGERNGRYFTDFTQAVFDAFMRDVPELELKECWVTTDVRPGRDDEKWLNVIMQKK